MKLPCWIVGHIRVRYSRNGETCVRCGKTWHCVQAQPRGSHDR